MANLTECVRLSDGKISVNYNDNEVMLLPDKDSCTIDDISKTVEEIAKTAYEDGEQNKKKPDKIEW